MNGMAITGPLPSLAPPMRMIAPVRTGLEILAQCPDVDCIVVPVGGGGLIAGKHPSSRPPLLHAHTTQPSCIPRTHAPRYPSARRRWRPWHTRAACPRPTPGAARPLDVEQALRSR